VRLRSDLDAPDDRVRGGVDAIAANCGPTAVNLLSTDR
jgi:hypothetical protein